MFARADGGDRRMFEDGETAGWMHPGRIKGEELLGPLMGVRYLGEREGKGKGKGKAGGVGKGKFVVEVGEGIFKRDRAFREYLERLEDLISKQNGVREPIALSSENEISTGNGDGGRGEDEDEDGMTGREEEDELIPFTIKRIPHSVWGTTDQGFRKIKPNPYPVWHAPKGKYSRRLIEENENEKWGDPEEGIVGDMRSDRWATLIE